MTYKLILNNIIEEKEVLKKISKILNRRKKIILFNNDIEMNINGENKSLPSRKK